MATGCSPSRQQHQSAANSVEDTVRIYTDWANHYLEKARNKRYISDLQQDVTDGVLLADVIEAVTSEKLQDIKTKPKNSAQMVENINTCLTFLANLGVSVDGLSAKDIREGNLKSILGLFFSLSRYKQQQKTQQQQQQQHKQQEHQRAHQGETTTDNQGGKNSNQTNGEEVQSRLPAYKQQSNKCPIIAHPSAKDAGHNSRNKSQGSGSSGSKGRQQLNQQNNNTSATIGSDVSTPVEGSAAHRATSPAGSGIPTPGGRSLGSRSQSAADKPSRAAQSSASGASTPTPTAQSKASAQKANLPASKQNSMLDKFKLFNSKEKAKTKSGLVKNSSKASSTGSTSTSTISTSSRSDSSVSARSSSSADAGGASSSCTSTTDPESPQLSKPRPIVGGVIGPKRENLGSLTIGHTSSRQPSPSPAYSSSLPCTPTSSLPTSNGKKSALKSQRADGQPRAGSVDTSKLPQSGSQTFTRGTKVSSLIPKQGSRTPKSSSTTSLATTQNSSGSQIPTPGSSIPKPSSGKPGKPGKEEKMRGTGSKDPSKHGMGQAPSGTASLTKKSSKSAQSSAQFAAHQQANAEQQHHQQQQQLQQQQQHKQQLQQQKQASQSSPSHNASQSSSHAPPVPPHRNGSQSEIKVNANSLPRQHSKPQTPTSSMQGQVKVSQEKVSQDGGQNSLRTRYTEIEYTDGRIERIGEGHFNKPTNQAVATAQVGDSQRNYAHPYLITSQSVNVVKPTCNTAHSPSVKSDGNTQTTLSILHRSAQPPPLPKTEPPPSTRTTVNNTNTVQTSQSGQQVATGQCGQSEVPTVNTPDSVQDASQSSSNSSNESIVLNTSATNSPKLGVKVLGSQMTRPANNVAIVQPHHGEKKETTFDTEVRTEMINKGEKLGLKNPKETTFSEKNTTFVDDSGETLDIQPMQPINRSMPYSGGYMRGYASPGKPLPLSMSQGTCGYATTGVVSGPRLGMNRSLMETGKYYTSPMKRAMSSGSGNVSMDDYNSDYDSYDYVSGYMSDGDILKNNRMDDMSSGYMSEGGASLYARRLQQRFREGMQAVKECMQKSSGVTDDDSFDDSSSISSGDISDTINEISTDEGNLTGGSGQSDPNPYSSLKRGPKDLFRNLTNENLHGSPGKRVPNLGTSAFLGSDYASDGAGGGHTGGWRKYSLQNNRLLSSDPADYAYLYSGYEQWRGGGSPGNQGALGSLRKLSNASQPDIHYRSHSTTGDYADTEKTYSSKCDSETNTDQSHVYDASVRKMQNAQNVRNMQGGHVGFGYRRPLSNVSTGSAGSNKSAPGAKTGSNTVGTRLAKHGLDHLAQQYHSATSKQRQEQSAAAQLQPPGGKEGGPGPEYSSASLERRGHGIHGNKSSCSAQTDMDMYKSNSLGRRKGGIGSKVSAENGGLCNSTIISNPHATFGKGDPNRQHSPYSSINIQGHVVNQNGGHTGNYVSMEYAMGSPRNSGNSPANWIRSNSATLGSPGGQVYHHVSDSESMDALSSASSIQARIQQARALSGASARILANQREHSHGYGLQRSNSMKSTQSDYASPQHAQQHHHHGEDISRTNSYSNLPSPPPPSSPTPSNSSHSSSRFTYPMTTYGSSPASNPALAQNLVRSNTSSSLPYGNMVLTKGNKDEEDSLHGSSLSLVSSSSSVYSTTEEKQHQEIRKLKRELESAHEKVCTLTTQLSTNHPYANCLNTAGGQYKAHVVAAFEQSLSNMTSRLQHLTNTAEQKDSELNELRATIEALKRQSGLSIQDPLNNGNAGRRHTTPGMVGKDLNAHHAQGGRVFHTLPMPNEGRIQRQISSDSMSSINSMSSACSATSQQSAATDGDIGKKKKKKGWLRSSFSKAFTAKKKSRNGSLSDVELDTTSLRSTLSVPNSPLLQVHLQNGAGAIKGSHSSGALSEGEDSVTVMDLRKQLRDKDMKLTDIRLEALSSAHQLEQLRETMNKMKNDMCALKSDNDRLQRMVQSSQSLSNSQSSLLHHNRTSSESLERTISLTENTSLADLLIQESPDREGRRVTITVHLGSNPDPGRSRLDKVAEVLIGSLAVCGKTKWEILDNIVRKILKEYVLRIDPVTNLGLSAESVFCYHIGDIIRTKESEVPELLPVGYLVGETMQIGICLKGTRQNSVDSLAFETLIPKSIVQRYISLLMEHRRIILCGPSGTGKTYLAQKLAEHLVLRSGKELTAGSVATFNVDHKSAKELRQYLANIAEQCENTSVGELPSVIILDNLHHVGSLGEVFNGFLSVKYQKCPYIIGTMNQATCSTTNLQLHHNFRWVLCANHMEPVKGFLGRFLRRRLVEAEVMTSLRNNDLNKIIDWIPKVWLHVNKFLETHSSSDVTIGPRLFLSCPMEIAGSKIWFTDLWNYSIVPYLLEAVREGLQVYGRRAQWEDPADWVLETFPWAMTKEEEQVLLKIRPEDVGYDTLGVSSENSSPKIQNKDKGEITATDSDGDPLVSDV